MWLGKERAEGKQDRWCLRIRGPLSPAWRLSQRGGQGRAAWLYSQPGDIRSPSARSGPEPEQGKPAHRRRDIQRGADREGMQGGGPCAKRTTHIESVSVSTHTDMHSHTYTVEKRKIDLKRRLVKKNTYINKHLHNRESLRWNSRSCNKHYK